MVTTFKTAGTHKNWQWPNSSHITYAWHALLIWHTYLHTYIYIYIYTAQARICTPLIVSRSLRSLANYIRRVRYPCPLALATLKKSGGKVAPKAPRGGHIFRATPTHTECTEITTLSNWRVSYDLGYTQHSLLPPFTQYCLHSQVQTQKWL